MSSFLLKFKVLGLNLVAYLFISAAGFSTFFQTSKVVASSATPLATLVWSGTLAIGGLLMMGHEWTTNPLLGYPGLVLVVSGLVVYVVGSLFYPSGTYLVRFLFLGSACLLLGRAKVLHDVVVLRRQVIELRQRLDDSEEELDDTV